MRNKTLIFSLSFAFCFLFTVCKEPGNIDSNSDTLFSHKSGVYSRSFELSLNAKEGGRVYYSIDGSIPSKTKVDNKRVFEYKSPITIKDRNNEENLLVTWENVRLMYPHPDDPERFDPNHEDWLPQPFVPQNPVPKASVIRAVEVYPNGKQSAVMTRTYFIGNNLAGYANHPVISIVTDPANLLDYNKGIYVQGPGRSRYEYNYAQKGREWERDANMELFDSSRNAAVASGVGIRVRGGWTRENGQKSFNVYFRAEYGLNNLRDYELIPGAVQADGKTPMTRYKNFILRNGGNDTPLTKLRDVYIQSLFGDRNFIIQAGVPCILYLNGEYWGFYNLQEKYSDNHAEYKYGVNKDNVIIVKTGELDEGVASDMNLYWSMMEYRNKDLSNPAIYNEFCELFDIQNFVDYFAAEIYIYNEDWPQNNTQLWRVRNIEQGNPYGDGKWRWMMYDTEFSMGIYSDGSLSGQENQGDPFHRILNGVYKDHPNNALFKKLLTNQDFCKQFIITMMDLYNVNFDYNSNIAKLDNMARIYKPLMNQYWERFNHSWVSFDESINIMKKYMSDIRPAMTNNYLPAYFSSLGITSGTLYNVTLKTTGATNAAIKLNTIPHNLSSGWTGKYYANANLPVTVTANVPSGYKFDGWTLIGGSAAAPSAETTAVNFSGNVTITANYSQK